MHRPKRAARTHEPAHHVEHVDERQRQRATRERPLQLRPRDRVAHRRDDRHLQQRHRNGEVEAVQREQRLPRGAHQPSAGAACQGRAAHEQVWHSPHDTCEVLVYFCQAQEVSKCLQATPGRLAAPPQLCCEGCFAVWQGVLASS